MRLDVLELIAEELASRHIVSPWLDLRRAVGFHRIRTRQSHPEAYREADRAYRLRHLERVRAKNRRYYWSNREAISQRHKLRRLRFRQPRPPKLPPWKQRHREKYLAYLRAYYQRNKAHLNHLNALAKARRKGPHHARRIGPKRAPRP